jgi:hypothetical protein
MKNKYIFLVLALIMIFSLNFNAYAYSQEKADFTLRYEDNKIPFKIFSIFLLPGEEIKLTAKNGKKKSDFAFIGSDGQFLYRDGTTLAWKAPEKSGHYSIKVRNKSSNSDNSQITLNIFVLHPYREKQNGYIDGFKIGSYPQIPADKNGYYKTPKGFLKIEKSMLDLMITPHFKLEQFLTNQTEDLPHYVVIKESLLLKLEYLLEEFNNAGFSVNTFGVVSTYRTPYFNKEIGNNTHHTRHIYGDAADIYIDTSGDSQMDDLNNDGKIDINDANVMLDIAVKFDKTTKYSELVGGASSYKSNCVRGPFIHIDTRGFHVTW